jgi:hypothetical protein
MSKKRLAIVIPPGLEWWVRKKSKGKPKELIVELIQHRIELEYSKELHGLPAKQLP